jgi:ATP-binding cassette subfamily B protein
MMMLIMNGLGVLGWARAVAQSTILVGDVMAAVHYASIIVMAFLMLSTIVILLRASISGDRIADVLATVPGQRPIPA